MRRFGCLLAAIVSVSIFGSLFGAAPAPKPEPTARTIEGSKTIEQNIHVKKGEKLVIKPGVTLTFARGVGISSEGITEAIGTKERPIIFAAKDPVHGWANVTLGGPGANGSVFRFCRFSGGRGRYYQFNKNMQIEKVVAKQAENAAGCGGAIFIYGAKSVRVEHCRFEKNKAGWGGGAISCWGEAHAVIFMNYFEGNRAGEDGGAIHCVVRSSPSIVGNYITGNAAQYGGAIHCLHLSNPSISWNHISRNTASKSAGAVVGFNQCFPTLTSNCITGNTAVEDAGALNAVRRSELRLFGNYLGNNKDKDGTGKGLTDKVTETTSSDKESVMKLLKQKGVLDLKKGAP